MKKIENKQRAWTAALCVEKEAPLSPERAAIWNRVDGEEFEKQKIEK